MKLWSAIGAGLLGVILLAGPDWAQSTNPPIDGPDPGLNPGLTNHSNLPIPDNPGRVPRAGDAPEDGVAARTGNSAMDGPGKGPVLPRGVTGNPDMNGTGGIGGLRRGSR